MIKWQDVRSKMIAEPFNELWRCINRINKVGTAFEHSAIEPQLVWLRLTHQMNYLHGDVVVFNTAPYAGIRRGALPVRTIDQGQLVPVRSRVNELQYFGRGGMTTWGYGWNGYNTKDVTMADMTARGVEDFYFTDFDYVGGIGMMIYANPLAVNGIDWPAVPNVGDTGFELNKIYGQTGAPPWWPTHSHPKDVLDGFGNPVRLFFGDPYNPVDPGFTHGLTENDGIYEHYPVTLPSPFLLTGYAGSPVDFGDTSHIFSPVSYFGANIIPLSFPWLLKSVPEGTTIVEAKCEVKVGSLTKTDYNYSAVYNETTHLVDVVEDTETSNTEGISIVLFQRIVNGEMAEWSPVGASLSLDGAGAGTFVIADVTALCQLFVDSLRYGEADSFGFAPAPFAGVFGAFDGNKGFMKSMLPTINYTAWLDPTWDGGPHNIYGGGDTVYISSAQAKNMTWTDCTLGRLYIEFKYPSGENRRAVSYFNAPPMNDL